MERRSEREKPKRPEEELRAGIIGMGCRSKSKSYFPLLRRKLDDLERVSKELKRSEERFRAIFDSISEAVFIHDIDSGAVLEVNRRMCEMFGCTRDEALKLDVAGLSVNQDAYTKETALARLRAAAEGTPQVFDWKSRRKNGQSFWAEVNLRRAEIGGKLFVLATARDIEEKKKLEERLAQAQRLESIGRLAGGVAHDYNNMLSVITGRVEIALKRTGPEHPAFIHLQEALQAAKRSAELTKQLLTFARKQPVAPVAMNINDAVSKLLGMLEQLIGERIAIRWEPENALWPVMIDPSQLDQIILNLAINARDAISGEGVITISTAKRSLAEAKRKADFEYPPGDYAVLSISDTGSGMDQETQKRIFEPFFTTKELGKGTGLGLATVYGIVKQCDGFIEVESAPGEGARFEICLPRAKKIDDAGMESSAACEGGGESVLLVEDEPTALSLFQDLLESMGYKPKAMRSPAAALAFAKNEAEKIDLLLTDVIMPGMGGKTLYEEIKKIRPSLKCLFMSGYPGELTNSQGALSKDVHFLQKPFTSETLASKIRQILDERQK